MPLLSMICGITLTRAKATLAALCPPSTLALVMVTWSLTTSTTLDLGSRSWLTCMEKSQTQITTRSHPEQLPDHRYLLCHRSRGADDNIASPQIRAFNIIRSQTKNESSSVRHICSFFSRVSFKSDNELQPRNLG